MNDTVSMHGTSVAALENGVTMPLWAGGINIRCSLDNDFLK